MPDIDTHNAEGAVLLHKFMDTEKMFDLGLPKARTNVWCVEVANDDPHIAENPVVRPREAHGAIGMRVRIVEALRHLYNWTADREKWLCMAAPRQAWSSRRHLFNLSMHVRMQKALRHLSS